MVGILARAFALFVAGGILGFALNAVRAEPIALTAAPPEAVCEAGAATTTVVELAPADAAPVCADPSVLILDVRAGEVFSAGHVAGAVHLPCRVDELSGDVAERLAAAPTVLVYGASTDEARPVAETLARRHPDVRIIAGGFAAWEAAGQACSSGHCADCGDAAGAAP